MNVITKGKDPMMTRSHYHIEVDNSGAWFIVEMEHFPDAEAEYNYSIEWFLPKLVPKELKKKEDEIISHCKQILL